MPQPLIQGVIAPVLLMSALAACAGDGKGLDANGQPIEPGNGTPPPLTADFESIQANVFTPICTKCHIGAAAPEGLQLDAEHSYALLVGVPSTEVPSLLRVDPGLPDQSYIVLKLQGSPGIVGAQMPLGGPYLDQATIDVIRQWITDGAPQGAAASTPATAFTVTATSPADQSVVNAPVGRIVVAFNHEVDASLVNNTTLSLQRLGGNSASALEAPISLQIAKGNPRVVLITPSTALIAGTYRLTVRGTGGGALADLNAQTLPADYSAEFRVDASP
jgi:methionine-rich copper-binding protein CopC